MACEGDRIGLDVSGTYLGFLFVDFSLDIVVIDRHKVFDYLFEMLDQCL